jgi:hypothetical protein
VRPDEAVVDIGGGASPLAGQLVERGFADVTVLDVSEVALAAASDNLGAGSARVTWLEQDVRSWSPARAYGLWHDRAAFHFLVDAADRARYLAVLARAVLPAGAVVLATFAPSGPSTCSGLPVVRYDAEGLVSQLGPGFELVEARSQVHRTPRGTAQPFTWVALRRSP